MRRSVLLMLIGGTLLHGQDQPTFKSELRVVNVFANVHGKNGGLVKGLAKDDFQIFEDGRRQAIQYFAEQSDLPLTLGLLVDTSYSERRMLGIEQSATRKFLEQVLRLDKDRAFLIRFDKTVGMMQELTGSRENLAAAVNGLKAGPSSGGTALYDALTQAAALLRAQDGHKAIVVLSDGEDSSSQTALVDAITAVQRSDSLAFAIRITDEEIGSMVRNWNGVTRPDGRKILRGIAKTTGGGYFEYGRQKTLETIFAEIEDDLRNLYSLGYSPDGANQSTEFRKIVVKTRAKGQSVSAREGYYP